MRHEGAAAKGHGIGRARRTHLVLLLRRAAGQSSRLPHRYDGSQPAGLAPAHGSRQSPAPCILKCSPKPGACPNAAWRLSRTLPPSAPNTPALCIRRSCATGPGACPICGMALEPRTVTVGAANPELVSMTRRLWVGAVLTLPLLAIMVSDVCPAIRCKPFSRAGCWDGLSLRWQRRWCCGVDGLSSSVAGLRLCIAA